MSLALLTPELQQILSEVKQLGIDDKKFMSWCSLTMEMPNCDTSLERTMRCGLNVVKDPEFSL